MVLENNIRKMVKQPKQEKRKIAIFYIYLNEEKKENGKCSLINGLNIVVGTTVNSIK